MASNNSNGESTARLEAEFKSMAESIGELKESMKELQKDLKTLIQTTAKHDTDKQLIQKDIDALFEVVRGNTKRIEILEEKTNKSTITQTKTSSTLKFYGHIAGYAATVAITYLVSKFK